MGSPEKGRADASPETGPLKVDLHLGRSYNGQLDVKVGTERRRDLKLFQKEEELRFPVN